MQKLIRSLFFLLCLTAPLIAEEAYQVIEDQAKVSILTPSLANRKTLKIKLANGLEAYLISDPEATKSRLSPLLGAHVIPWHGKVSR
jgi:insulysin